jgi:uncharacterized repeat protein (TIGR01451 family)
LGLGLVIGLLFLVAPPRLGTKARALNPLALCAKPRARIDLVLPPTDYVPTHNANALIGSTFKFQVSFDNNQGTNPGYGPYLNVIFPAGLSFNNALGATYVGSQIIATPYPFGTSTTLVHPFTGSPVAGGPGAQLVVIELPFSSYTPQQPPADVIVNANLSGLVNVNQPLTIQVQAGFRYSCSGMGNGAALPSIPADNDSGVITTALFFLEKKYDGEEIGPQEGETATGPNFPHHYKIVVEVAPGQTVTNLTVTDSLPDNLAFKGPPVVITQVNGPPGVVTVSAPVGVASNNGMIVATFPSITGAATLNDVTVDFQFFIPQFDALGAPILDPQTGLSPSTGAAAVSPNEAKVEGMWHGALQTLDPPGPEYTLLCKAIALQKRGENTSQSNADVTAILPPTDNGPEDKIRWLVDFQVSDYFTFNQLSIDDLVSDGQFFLMFPAAYTPTYSISDQSHSTSASFPLTSVNATGLPCTSFPNERTSVVFTLPGSMTGGMALSTPSNVPAIGKITFYSRIQQDYMCPTLSGDFSVDQNDQLFNRATIKGTMLNNSTSQPIGPMQDDDQVDFRLLLGVPSKSVFAITNRMNVTLPANSSTLFAPGDKITFRLKYFLPHGDVEKLSLTDFFSIPILKTNLFSLSSLPMCSGVPAVNTACFQNGSLNLPSKPSVSAPPVNSLKFDYGTFDYPTASVPTSAQNIDVLLTLAIQPDPFVDGLTFMNQLMSQESNTFKEQAYQIAIAKFKVAEPKLNIRKAAIATDNACGQFSQPSGQSLCSGLPVIWAKPPLGATFSLNGVGGNVVSNSLATWTPSSLANVDVGDLVTFAMIVENTGSSPYGAFDVKISDTIPPGFVIPGGGANLTVRRGDNAAITVLNPANFFSTGIELVDPSANSGALKANSPTSGQNIAVITYTLKIDPIAGTCANLSNTGKILNYSSIDQGPNFADPVTGVSGQYGATQSVTVGPRISKTLVSTNQIYTMGSNVTIGETVTYNIRVNLPEGVTPSLTINDPLPAGLQAMVPLGTITGPAPVPVPTVTMTGACGAPVIVAFGPINVPVNNNPNDNWFEFQLQARVCNVSTNVGNGTQTVLNNSVTTGGNACLATAAAPVTVVEPRMIITKQVSPATLQVGGQVSIKLTVTNTGTSPAFDVVVEDPLLTAAFGNIAQVSTPSGWTFSTSASGANTLVRYQASTFTTIPNGGSAVFVFKATATACGTYANTAKVAHATTLLGSWLFERDESPVSASANIVVTGPSCPCVPPPLDLVDWWTFDEPLGGQTAFDKPHPPYINNNGAYGSGSQAPTPTVGGIGNYNLCFDGNDLVTVSNHPEVNFAGNCTLGATTESFTIDFWLKVFAPSSTVPLIDKRIAGPVGYYVYLFNGQIYFEMNGAVFPTTSASYNIGNNVPHFVAITVPRCTSLPATIYIDGVAMATFTPPPVNLVSNGILVIGSNALTPSAPGLRGCLDELEIFKRALSASEVQLIYAAGPAGKCK